MPVETNSSVAFMCRGRPSAWNMIHQLMGPDECARGSEQGYTARGGEFVAASEQENYLSRTRPHCNTS